MSASRGGGGASSRDGSARQILEGIDNGRFADAIEASSSGKTLAQTPDRETTLVRAEVASYCGQYDEVATALLVARAAKDELDAESDDARLARRALMLEAEARFGKGERTEAEELASEVLDAANRARDQHFVMRSKLLLGRIATQRAEYPATLERLAGAARIADEQHNEFYQGRIATERAIALQALGESTAAERRFREAIALLTRTENLVERSSAQAGLGRLLVDSGRFAEAFEILTQAESGTIPVVAGSDPKQRRYLMASAMLGLGQYADAVNRLEALLELERATANRPGEARVLGLIARAELGRSHLEAAERAAHGSAAIIATLGSRDEGIHAKLLAGRISARLNRDGVASSLTQLLFDIDASGTETQRAEARICLAEALIYENPIESRQLLEEARAMDVTEATVELRDEVDRVDRERLRAPVRVAEDGTLVIDTRVSYPKLKHAREALERYLLSSSLTDTRGNAAAAGRLIGETRYQMHYLKRIFERGEGRPSRARAEDEEHPAESKRSATRPKRLVRRRGK